MLFTKNLQGVQKMYETNNMTRGFKPASQLEDESTKKPKIRTHFVPQNIFKDFDRITPENEKIFEFLVYYFTAQVLEKLTDDFWCLEFPSCIAGEGRAILHEVAHYFGLACHSQGKSG
jgi:hypothetical protein